MHNVNGLAAFDCSYIGVHGNKLAANIYGHAEQPVLFFHGGGADPARLGRHGASRATSGALRHNRGFAGTWRQ